MAKSPPTQNALVIPAAAKDSDVSRRLLTEAPAYVQKANALVIDSPQSHALAVELLQLTARQHKLWNIEREKITGPAHKAWKAACDFFTALVQPYEDVDKIVRQKVRVYEAAEREKADKLRREAEETARRERERIEAEARRKQREAQDKADEERRQANIARQQQEEAQRQAEEARKAGDLQAQRAAEEAARIANQAAQKADQRAETITTRAADKVDQLNFKAASVVAASVAAPQLKVAGKSNRTTYKYRIINPQLIDRRYLVPNEKMLGDLVKAMKTEAPELIGSTTDPLTGKVTYAIEVYEEADLSIKAAKP